MTTPRALIRIAPLAALAALGATLFGAPAYAGPVQQQPDLVTTITSPTARVGDVAHVDVRITNIGNKTPTTSTVAITLPKTSTSPSSYLLGSISNITPSTCVRSGTTINCTLTNIVKNGGSQVIGFDMVLPYSVKPIVFGAVATTTNERNAADNTASFTASQSYWTVSDAAPANLTVTSCTGTNLGSFYDCVVSPGSTQQHSVALVPGGALDFSANGPDADGMTGSWAVNGTELTMTYDGVGTFVGQGASANCWEGRMTFLNSTTYSAMYKVCR